jgi:uncharacterized integral membrane protein
MVEINYKVVIAGFICLSIIYMTLIICNRESTTIGYMIVSAIALGIGVVIPAPKVDNKKGVLKW